MPGAACLPAGGRRQRETQCSVAAARTGAARGDGAPRRFAGTSKRMKRKETPDVMHLPRQGAVKDCARGPASALPAGTAGDGGHVPVHGALLVRLLPSWLRRESAVWDTFMPSGAALSPEAWRQGAKNCRRQPFLASLQFAEMKVYLGR